MNHINTQTVTTRRWAGIERTLYLLMGLCWVALLSVTLLFVADVAGCEREHRQRGPPIPARGSFLAKLFAFRFGTRACFRQYSASFL